MVISHQGEDDHSDEVGNHADVEGDRAELLPLGPQQLVDGLHSQHLMTVLTAGPETQNRLDQRDPHHVCICVLQNQSLTSFRLL